MSTGHSALLVQSFSCPDTIKNTKVITKEFHSSSNNIVSLLTTESQNTDIAEWCL